MPLQTEMARVLGEWQLGLIAQNSKISRETPSSVWQESYLPTSAKRSVLFFIPCDIPVIEEIDY